MYCCTAVFMEIESIIEEYQKFLGANFCVNKICKTYVSPYILNSLALDFDFRKI